jgi:signal transduction histidine kinase
VRNLLAFARPPRPQLARCDAGELIERVRGLVSEQAAVGNVQLSIEHQADERSCHADPAQITQVLLNLALNAVQACGGGDRVVIASRALSEDGTDWIEFGISDTGKGVPAEVRGSLFDPFVTTKAQGTGLGLAICRQIVGDHRGSIACEFLERGTRFAVRVPAWRASAASARTAQPARST